MAEKVVVITGAGSGLGASLAKKYSEMGHYVCLLGRTKRKLEQIASTLTNRNSVYEVDVSSKGEVNKVFQTIHSQVGSIDILINNAGVGAFDIAESVDEEFVHRMIDINLKGTIFCSQAVLSDMKKSNEGTIVNVISTAGLEGKATESVYCASKFGVRGFTESLQIELQDTDVHAFAAYMGGMKTAFWNDIYSEEEIKHLMEPDDVADILLANIKARRNLNVTEVVIRNNI